MLKIHKDWLNSEEYRGKLLEEKNTIDGKIILNEKIVDPNRRGIYNPKVYSITNKNEFGYEYELEKLRHRNHELFIFFKHTGSERMLELEFMNTYCIFIARIYEEGVYKPTKAEKRDRANPTKVAVRNESGTYSLKEEKDITKQDIWGYNSCFRKISEMDLDSNCNIMEQSRRIRNEAVEKHPEQYTKLIKDAIAMYYKLVPSVMEWYNEKHERAEKFYRECFIEEEMKTMEERHKSHLRRYNDYIDVDYERKIKSGEIRELAYKYTVGPSDHGGSIAVRTSNDHYVLSTYIHYDNESKVFCIHSYNYKRFVRKYHRVYRFDLLDINGVSILNEDLSYVSSKIKLKPQDTKLSNGKRIIRLEEENADLKKELVAFYKQIYTKFDYSETLELK